MSKQLQPYVPDAIPASLLKRLAVLIYDGLLSLALLMVSTGFYMIIKSKIVGADAYAAAVEAGNEMNDPFYKSFVFVLLFVFFAYFWTKTGQTLGMLAWRLRVQNNGGYAISPLQALIRFMVAGLSLACAGLGYWWAFFDKKGRTWQCIASGSEVVELPKAEKRS